ncbi:MAG: hypothetical protein DDT37_01790 [Firmicutes bacterium]|nr:hypothetical protein [candidate division NPL-UPA2 bacterium]
MANFSVAAHYYAQHFGWAVLPLHSLANGRCTCGNADCASPAKHPLTQNGVKDASADPDVIAGWWRRWPNANVGIATGGVSGFFVLDVDGEAGAESLRELEAQYGKLPNTVEQLTGGGGKHVLFKLPKHGVKNAVALRGGLDVRGDGGYIVVPPSVHSSGREYVWELSSRPGEVPLADAPEWLLTMIKVPVNGTKTAQDWAAAIPEGQRNAELAKRAGVLLARGLPAAEVLTMVAAVNTKHCKPPLAEGEVATIVRSIAAREGGNGGTPKSGGMAGINIDEVTFLTDYYNAQRLIAHSGQDLRYCEPWRKWLVWNGNHWGDDDTLAVMRHAKETVKAMVLTTMEGVATATTDETRDYLFARARLIAKCFSRQKLEAMITLAQSEQGIPVLPTSLDRNPYLFNVKNGTVNLQTGELQRAQRSNLLTKTATTDYNPGAKCPLWLAFLDRIFSGNQFLISYVQKMAGYSLTGDVSEQALFILYGKGANGKTVLITTLLSALGEYGKPGAMNLLMAKKHEQHPTEIADLQGARLITVTESGEGKRLAENLVKQLTGGDKLKARRMREDFWDFEPTHKIWLATNHKPEIKGGDHAIWRRIRLIPFTVTIPDEEQDKQLAEKLKQELQGILNWMVEGCLAWQREGLRMPEEVTSATQGYAAEMNTIKAFVEETCVAACDARITLASLYFAYSSWCSSSGERPVSRKKLAGKLEELGYEKRRGSENKVFIFGIGLKDG